MEVRNVQYENLKTKTSTRRIRKGKMTGIDEIDQIQVVTRGTRAKIERKMKRRERRKQGKKEIPLKVKRKM